ncbi:hypothetical protein L9F63_006225, partial [Diploptera punctata]
HLLPLNYFLIGIPNVSPETSSGILKDCLQTGNFLNPRCKLENVKPFAWLSGDATPLFWK